MVVLRKCFAGMLIVLLAGPAWAQEDWDAAKEPAVGGFGYWTQRQEDSVKTVFAHEEHLTHVFGDFYRIRGQRWVLVHYRFGIPEGERHPFTYTYCPPIDPATFRELPGSYWQDKHGAYYAELDSSPPDIVQVRGANLASFRSLGFEHLAVDKYRVYQLGRVLPGLVPATLRLYTPQGYRTEDWDFNQSAYLISGNTVYDTDGHRLTVAQARQFRLPKGYRLAYPVLAQTVGRSRQAGGRPK